MNERVFCHVPCIRCHQRHCTLHGCPMTARYQMFLVINYADGRGEERYIISCSFCEQHKDKIPRVPDTNIWNYIKGLMKDAPEGPPRREDCRIDFLEY